MSVSLNLRQRRITWHCRTFRLGQDLAADGPLRSRAGKFWALLQLTAQTSRNCQKMRWRNFVVGLSASCLPVLPSHPQHDGAGKRRRAAGTRRSQMPTRSSVAQARARRKWASPIGVTHYPRRTLGWRAAACGNRPRARTGPRHAHRRRADRKPRSCHRPFRSPTSLFSKAAESADMTLVLVTHDMQLAGRCARQIRMRSGQVLDEALANA
jgi:hypothetical protein